MGAKNMTTTQQAIFIKSMEEQGVGVTRTRKGLFLRLPDGTSTSLHFTNSDYRAQQNLINRLRRAGVRHPEDPKNVERLGRQITDAQPVAQKTKDRILEYVVAAGYPQAVTVKGIILATGMAHITITRALYQMGFKPIPGRYNSRDWLVPDEVLAKKPEPEPEPDVEVKLRETTVLEPTPDEPEQNAEPESPTFSCSICGSDEHDYLGHPSPPTPVPKAPAKEKPEREFIDTHDSWTLDLKELGRFGFFTVEQLATVLRAAGLEMEIRVWRT